MTEGVEESDRLGPASCEVLRGVARPGNGYSPPEPSSLWNPSPDAVVTLRRPTRPVPRTSRASHSPRWPLRPAPLPGELLSFWLARVAWANGITYWDLFSILWGSEPCRFVDVDIAVHQLRLEELAARADLPSEKIRGLGLFSGQIDPIFRHRRPQAGLRWRPWVLALGRRHEYQSRPGLAYCPWCLEEDAIPFVRREWRYVTTFCCDRHRRFLEVGCPICRFAVDFRHAGLERRPWTTCRRCGADLRRGIRGRPRGRLCPTAAMIEAQVFFLAALKSDWVDLGRGNEATVAELLLMLNRAPVTILRRLSRGPRLGGQIDRIRKRLLFLGLRAHKGHPAPLRLQSPRARATVATLFVRMLQSSPCLSLRNAIGHARAELVSFGEPREVSYQYTTRTGPVDLLSMLVSVLSTETEGARLLLEDVGLRYRPARPAPVASWRFSK